MENEDSESFEDLEELAEDLDRVINEDATSILRRARSSVQLRCSAPFAQYPKDQAPGPNDYLPKYKGV